jgi:hypothetical protein
MFVKSVTSASCDGVNTTHAVEDSSEFIAVGSNGILIIN